MGPQKPLHIFVHHASELLTDHEPHGDGLICFSLLNGLAERGHSFYAFTKRCAVKDCSPRLHVREFESKSPLHSLAAWELSYKANKWYRELSKQIEFDLVWRMHPYNRDCPLVPLHDSLPLVIGPVPYDWPEGSVPQNQRPKSRFGFSLANALTPIAMAGWQNTLNEAKLLFCMTAPHAVKMQNQNPHLQALPLPVIVEPPPTPERPARWDLTGRPIKLVFAANLLAHKHPEIFCELVKLLRTQGYRVQGTLIGDGPERARLERWANEHNLTAELIFRGKIPHSEVWGEMATADLLISTSFGEPYGRGIVEAMSTGTPCVCHASGGPADFISDCRSGLLVSELNAEAYAQAIKYILDSPDRWTQLSHEALRSASLWRANSILDHVEAALYSILPSKKVHD